MSSTATNNRFVLGYWLQQGQPTRPIFLTLQASQEMQSNNVEWTAIEFNKQLDNDTSSAHGVAVCLRSNSNSDAAYDKLFLSFHHSNVNSADLKTKILHRSGTFVWREPIRKQEVFVMYDVNPRHCLYTPLGSRYWL